MLVVDSDLAVAWLFAGSHKVSESLAPIGFAEAKRIHERIILPFVCVPELFRVARWLADDFLDPEFRQDYLDESMNNIQVWLTSFYEVYHATSLESRSWLTMATNPLLPQHVTDAHCWVAVIHSRLNVMNPGNVYLGSIERSVYCDMQEGGFLMPECLL